MPRAWAFISITKGRQYGGNLGYNDDPKRTYSYDSSVPNHLRVGPGDLVIIRDREAVLGIARVEHLNTREGLKTRLRCPTCQSPQIKERLQNVPRWRCVHGHTFDLPLEEQVKVQEYEAVYGASFIDLGEALSVSDLKRAASRPNDQLSIEEIDVTKLAYPIVGVGSEARDLLAQFLQSTQANPRGYNSTNGVQKSDGGDQYHPSFTDTRERINQGIALRRGQAAFRSKLLRRYGPSCMITDCHLLEIVEAAHIWPYRGNADNHPANGLLLRADLHTLFDIDLVGINPENMAITFHPLASSAGYNALEGTRLRLGRAMPSGEALALRWRSFTKRLTEEKMHTGEPQGTTV